jgi:pyruvate ferredoxin oxidoreductase gamma subunit
LVIDPFLNIGAYLLALIQELIGVDATTTSERKRMKEIRIHGRGGQGSLVLAQFMAIAALEDGKYGQAFPFLGGGGERRGKPIVAFCRLSERPIRIRSHIHEPDYVIVQDATILSEVDVAEGLKQTGSILINTDKSVAALGLKKSNAVTISADKMARRILGRPIINTALLGTFAGFSHELSLEAVLKAVRSKFPGEIGEKNAQVVAESYHAFLKESS